MSVGFILGQLLTTLVFNGQPVSVIPQPSMNDDGGHLEIDGCGFLYNLSFWDSLIP